MTVPRIFLKKLLTENETIKIGEGNFHYLVRVMRLKKGNKFYCVDETGREFLGEILDVGKNSLLAKFNFLKLDSCIDYNVSLFYGLLKGEKNELIVSIASSLGVSEIIPVNMERTVIKLEKEKAHKKRERLQKIAVESARVSYLLKEPIIREIKELRELTFYQDSLKILFSEKTGIKGLADYQDEIKKANKIIVFFGPEGGIAEEEHNFLIKNGFEPVSLGERVVKSEIAILYGLSVIRFLKNGKL